MKVIDNFLPEEEFKRLQKIVMLDIPWFFQPSINTAHKDDNTCYFTHTIYNYGRYPRILSGQYFEHFKQLSDKLEIHSLIRMKLNLYPKTTEIETHEPHTDYSYNHKGCILSFNTCNGGTILYDEKGNITKVDSVENRALLFDPSQLHSSTSCTNAKARFNVNINYF